MPASQMDRPLIATLALCVLALGAWTLNREAAQYLAVGSRIQRVAAIPEQPPFPGLALSTRQDNLRDCVFALQRQASLEVRYVSEEFRASLPARCAAMALDAVELMPTYSYGWFVLAYTDAVAGNWDAMNQHLYMSQVTGQASQWVAEQRVAVAESYREHLDVRSLVSNDADLQMLVLSQRGIRSIAARYVNEPTFRERITTIVEGLPEQTQRSFIDVLNGMTR